MFHADTNEQNRRRDNIRIFGLEEAADEHPYQKVLEVAQQVGLEISKTDVGLSHRVPSRSGKRPVMMFFRRQTKIVSTTRKEELQQSKSPVYNKEDLTILGPKIAAKLRAKDELKGVTFLDGKNIVFDSDCKKLVFDNPAQL